MVTDTMREHHTLPAAHASTLSMERTLRLIAGVVVTTSILLGMYVHPYWFYLGLFAGLNLFQSGITNWCPMMAILRRVGLR